MKPSPPLVFDNSYAQLPDRFFDRQSPTAVSRPGLIRVNHALAKELGIDPGWLASPEGVEMLAGNRLPPGPNPSRQLMPGISSATGTPNSETVAPFCWES